MKPVRALVWVLVGLLAQAATITLTNQSLPRAVFRPGAAPEAGSAAWLDEINRLRQAARLTPVALDRVMAAGARCQAALVSGLPAGDVRHLPARRLLEAWWEAGAWDGNPSWRVLSQDSRSKPGPVAGFQLGSPLAGDISHIGIGSVIRQGTRWTVICAARRRVLLSMGHPGPYQPHGRLWLSGSVLPGFMAPRLMLTRPDGSVAERPLSEAGSHFEALIELDGRRGRHMIEIMLDGPWGPVVAALFPVDVGGGYSAPPPHPAGDDARMSLAHLQERMLALINADRHRFGVPPVQLSGRLSGMAQGHSEDMKLHGFFAHVSPRSGDLGDRLKAAGLPPMVMGENIAVAGSLGEAEEGLMASPAHRAMILDRQMTVVGLGIAYGAAHDGEAATYWVTQNYGERAPE